MCGVGKGHRRQTFVGATVVAATAGSAALPRLCTNSRCYARFAIVYFHATPLCEQTVASVSEFAAQDGD
jgi:hypothetical protein